MLLQWHHLLQAHLTHKQMTWAHFHNLSLSCLESYNGFRKNKTPKNRLPHRHIRDSDEPVIGQAIEYLDIIGKSHSNKRQIESDDEFEDYLSFITIILLF